MKGQKVLRTTITFLKFLNGTRLNRKAWRKKLARVIVLNNFMESQKQKILNLLLDLQWHCTSEFYAMFIADPRRRLCTLREEYVLENRKCHQHNFHKGYSKEWRLIEKI